MLSRLGPADPRATSPLFRLDQFNAVAVWATVVKVWPRALSIGSDGAVSAFGLAKGMTLRVSRKNHRPWRCSPSLCFLGRNYVYRRCRHAAALMA